MMLSVFSCPLPLTWPWARFLPPSKPSQISHPPLSPTSSHFPCHYSNLNFIYSLGQSGCGWGGWPPAALCTAAVKRCAVEGCGPPACRGQRWTSCRLRSSKRSAWLCSKVDLFTALPCDRFMSISRFLSKDAFVDPKLGLDYIQPHEPLEQYEDIFSLIKGLFLSVCLSVCFRKHCHATEQHNGCKVKFVSARKYAHMQRQEDV